MSNHPIVHIEFSAPDQAQAAKFYSNLFGWEFEHHPEFKYSTFRTSPGNDDLGGGINSTSDDYPAGTVVFYVGTDDIDASLAKAEGLGSKTLMPKMEIPGQGWMGMFLDPYGNKVGLFTSLPGSGD